MNKTSAPVVLLADDPWEMDPCKMDGAWVTYEDIGTDLAGWLKRRITRFPKGTVFELVASESEAKEEIH